MKVLVSLCTVFLLMGTAIACSDTECDNEMMESACGTTASGVECSYQSGWGDCDETPVCSCRDSGLDFIYGFGCACPSGKYGNPDLGDCYVCPGGQTSWVGENTLITSCHIPSGTESSDSTGRFTYTSNCHYK